MVNECPYVSGPPGAESNETNQALLCDMVNIQDQANEDAKYDGEVQTPSVVETFATQYKTIYSYTELWIALLFGSVALGLYLKK